MCIADPGKKEQIIQNEVGNRDFSPFLSSTLVELFLISHFPACLNITPICLEGSLKSAPLFITAIFIVYFRYLTSHKCNSNLITLTK